MLIGDIFELRFFFRKITIMFNESDETLGLIMKHFGSVARFDHTVCIATLRESRHQQENSAWLFLALTSQHHTLP